MQRSSQGISRESQLQNRISNTDLGILFSFQPRDDDDRERERERERERKKIEKGEKLVGLITLHAANVLYTIIYNFSL